MFLKKLQKINQEDKKLCLVGLGYENLQFLEWLLETQNFKPENLIILDKSENAKEKVEELITTLTPSKGSKSPILGVSFKESWKGVSFKTGKNYLDGLEEFEPELVIKTPGIWSLKKEFIEFRKKHGEDKIISPLAFFFEKYRDRIVAISGTKGKTTTAGLIAHGLNNLGIKAVHCGNTTNISPYKFWNEETPKIKDFDPLEGANAVVAENIDSPLENPQIFVIEISSFQLQDLAFSGLMSQYSVLTNLYIDHLDQHQNKIEYWKAKTTLFENQNGNKFGNLENQDYSAVSSQAIEIVNKFRLSEKEQMGTVEEINSKNIPEIEKIQTGLFGKHNIENTALAYKIIEKLKPEISKQQIQKSFQNFQNFPHRLEIILEKEINRSGDHRVAIVKNSQNPTIRIFDDGAASEPDAVAKGIEACFETKNDLVWLVVSGVDKGVELDPLLEALKENQNRILRLDLCGKIGEKLGQEIQKNNLRKLEEKVVGIAGKKFREFEFKNIESFILESLGKFGKSGNLEEFNKSEKRINLLFSPCGSSFDEFTNYDERAKWWSQNILENLE